VTAWIVILSIGVVSYALRATVLVTVAGRTLPESLLVPLSLVGPAALAALLATFLFAHGGTASTPPAAEVIAVLAGMFAVRRTGNMLYVFAVGLPVLWLSALAGV
jgi:branched-subunit amino acid transport protein